MSIKNFLIYRLLHKMIVKDKNKKSIAKNIVQTICVQDGKAYLLQDMSVNVYLHSSLLTWKHPEATRKLFIALCMALIASLVLKGPTLFMITGNMLLTLSRR